MTTIETVAEVKGGKRLPKGKKLLDEPTDHPYIRVTDFENASVNTQSLKYLDDETYDAIKNYTISDKDLYISIAGTIGLVGTIPKHLTGANLTENAAKIAEVTGVLNPYLSFVLNSNGAIEQFKDKATSSGQPKLALFRIKDCSFPLPPLAEQKVIAEKLDKLLAKVDSIKARLDAAPDTLKRFRQSVLAAAVSGKLTKEWRQSKGVSSTKACLQGLAAISGGKTPSKSNSKFWEGGEIPWVSPKDMKTDLIDSSQDKITKDAILSGGMKLVPQNAILVVTRSGILAHSFPVARTLAPVTVNQDIKALVPDLDLISSEFMFYLLKGLERRILDECSKAGTTVSSVETNLLMKLQFQLPSLTEQAEIVRRVEQLFAYADKVEAEVNAAQERVNKLTQSILAKAFRGELTAKWREQHPELISGDNSAEALLAKVKAEREKLKPKKSTRTRQEV